MIIAMPLGLPSRGNSLPASETLWVYILDDQSNKQKNVDVNSNAKNRGSIISGFNKSDGLARCVIAELPLRPLVSLAELSHWDVRYENSVPPYAFNIIANSDASPLLPSDKVVNSKDANLNVNFQHDDSY